MLTKQDIDNLQRICIAMHAGLPIPDDVVKWLLPALSRFCSTPGLKLDESLDIRMLPGDAYRDPRVSDAYEQRNKTIFRVSQKLQGSVTIKAKQIVSMLHELNHPLTQPIVNICQKHDIYLPKSEKQIARIIRDIIS